MRQFTKNTITHLKHWGVLSLFAFSLVGIIACGEEKRERPDVVKDVSENSSNPLQDQGNISTDLNTGGNNNGDVQHYICPNNCEGSGGSSQGTCPICGTAYVHNAAFHNQENQNANNQINLEGGDQLQDLQQQQQSQNAPAQNAAGEYHYICSAGCSGGAGSAGACSQCGANLEHNTAYHN